MSESAVSGAIDPIPLSQYPSFQPVATPLPTMPVAWSAVVLLHPFSPPLSGDPTPDNPFFQLCLARIDYSQGDYFSAQITGCEYGNWWYVVTSGGTHLSTDQGQTWTPADVGWTLPTNWFGAAAASATCAGSSPLNWMAKANVEWWKALVPHTSPPAAIWMWFDPASGAPVRMMFGQGPPSTTKGDPALLALFQMYSFSYVALFDSVSKPPARADLRWAPPSIPGFAVGNPKNYRNFVWNQNFGMTVFMTPVNGMFNPLPTRVLYVWKPDNQYSVYTDRAQHTLMRYDYNPAQPSPPLRAQIALLTGAAPHGVQPPPDSATGFLISHYATGTVGCIGGSKFPFPQEPPDWVSIPAAEARIRATITANPVLCPNRIVTVFSVLFPPAPPNYPEATYLWTWYSPENPDGTESHPVTFMQSQSGVGVGTSLALADYFYYENFSRPLDPANFSVPTECSSQTRKTGLRYSLP
jgi:hypothetical protein